MWEILKKSIDEIHARGQIVEFDTEWPDVRDFPRPGR